VISLNHFVDPETREALNPAPSPSYTPDAFWHHRRTFNTEFWYRKFFGPLARVAAAAFGEQLIREEESYFATHRMIFTEICPYGSQRFSLSWPDVAELLKTDVGFQCAAAVNRVLVERGRPALVMVNGLRSIDMFAHVYAGALTWQQSRYHSCDLPQEGRKHKQLTHYCGSLNLDRSVVPVVGFPFLRNPAAHNSNAELALLASHVRQCVVDQAAVATHVSARASA
jgi:hypothetical protein